MDRCRESGLITKGCTITVSGLSLSTPSARHAFSKRHDLLPRPGPRRLSRTFNVGPRPQALTLQVAQREGGRLQTVAAQGQRCRAVVRVAGAVQLLMPMLLRRQPRRSRSMVARSLKSRTRRRSRRSRETSRSRPGFRRSRAARSSAGRKQPRSGSPAGRRSSFAVVACVLISAGSGLLRHRERSTIWQTLTTSHPSGTRKNRPLG